MWSWDITKVPGPERGTYYSLYVILDIFSRYVVGWTLARTESTTTARSLLADAFERHGIKPGQLMLRGAPDDGERDRVIDGHRSDALRASRWVMFIAL